MKSKCLTALAGLMALGVASSAMADDCNNLGSNTTWNTNFANLETAIEKANYDEAIDVAKTLYGICQRSPALNYYTGMAMKGKGDTERAAIYFQKASEYTSDIAVDPGMSRRIWYARYESEHPDATPEALAAAKEKYDAQVMATADLQKQLQEQSQQLEVKKATAAVTTLADLESAVTNWKVGMWTSVGVTTLGVAMTIAGGMIAKKADKLKKSDTAKSGWKINPAHNAGWAVFGTGIGLGVTGLTMTIMTAYNYVKYSDRLDAMYEQQGQSTEETTEPVSYRFDVTPTSASFGMTF